MTNAIDTILVFMILTNFSLLGASRLATCIRMVALQGVVVGLMPLAFGAGVTVRVAVIAAAIIALKGFVFPHLLFRSLRESKTRREIGPYVGYIISLFAGVAILIGSFWLDARLRLVGEPLSGLATPVAFSMILTGLFVIVARRTALNQVLGYLVLENGIYTFGLAMVRDIPVLIELGVLMDMFVAVFVMGIAIYRINCEFDHIDADKLSKLRG